MNNRNYGYGMGMMPQPQYPQAYPGMPQQMTIPQQQIPTPVVQSIPGHIVNGMNDIVPNDVPMDGSCSFFPVSDGSAIYVKAWNSNGTIQTVKYVPETIPDQVVDTSTTTLDEVMKKLNSIEAKLGRKSYHNPPKKKEGDVNV